MNCHLCRPGFPRVSREAKRSSGTPESDKNDAEMESWASILRPWGRDDPSSSSNSNNINIRDICQFATISFHVILAMDVIRCRWYGEVVCHQMDSSQTSWRLVEAITGWPQSIREVLLYMIPEKKGPYQKEQQRIEVLTKCSSKMT